MNEIRFLPGRAWLSIPKFEQHLYAELGIYNNIPNEKNTHIYGNIIYSENIIDNIFWKRVELKEPFIAHFKSISEAAAILKEMQRNWAMQPFRCIRRSELIKQKLPFISEKAKKFPYVIPTSPMGIYTLLDENTLFASAKTSSPFPLGELHFIEDKINPPSRAYLKLYEALCLIDYHKRKQKIVGSDINCSDSNGILSISNKKPFAGLTCIDAGASPGGWTWVLDLLGANIIAIDRSSLTPTLMNKKNINFITHDAFTLPPSYFGKVDWVFSDVICYPPRLLEWLHKWLDSGLCNKFICTIKMQGKPDMKSIREAAAIPHSCVLHLTANKHELTFLNAPFI